MRELTRVRSRAIRLECTLKAQRAEGLMNGLDNYRYLTAKEDRRDEEGSSRRDRVRGSHTWTEEERIIAFHCLLRYGKDFDAVAEVLGTKTSDKVKSFYSDMKSDIDKLLEKEAEKEAEMVKAFDVEQEVFLFRSLRETVGLFVFIDNVFYDVAWFFFQITPVLQQMSTEHFTSPADSTGLVNSSRAEAMRYNASHNHRPASSRKLFASNTGDSRSHSEEGARELEPEEGGLDDRDDGAGNIGNKSIMTSETLFGHLNKMFSKLSEDMDKVRSIYGDGNFFVQSSISFEAELNELNKLCEADARDQLERYALRCHVSEREKEQLHRRNHELNSVVEILRTQVIRGQNKIVEQMRDLTKQAINALRDLEQTSSAEIQKWKQKHALSLAQSNTFQNQLKHTTAQLEAKKEINSKVAEIRELTEKLKKVESAAEAHVKRREEEITKQMDDYLQETKLVDAERERHARMRILEAQQRMKMAEDERDEAERRAKVAEEKVADYEANFIKYRGQMEGEALRAITNGYRNALSAIPSARRDVNSGIDRLFPLIKSSAYSENNEPPADPCEKSLTARNSRTRLPSRTETLSARSGLSNQKRKK
ncbi:Myb-like DNA-binding domain protein [Ostertagia ostertagi]